MLAGNPCFPQECEGQMSEMEATLGGAGRGWAGRGGAGLHRRTILYYTILYYTIRYYTILYKGFADLVDFLHKPSRKYSLP